MNIYKGYPLSFLNPNYWDVFLVCFLPWSFKPVFGNKMLVAA
jgi:hypothetical protein